MSVGRRILRVTLWIVGIVLGLVLVATGVLATTIALDRRGSTERLDSVANTTIPNADGPPVRAYVARPTTPGPQPRGHHDPRVLGA